MKKLSVLLLIIGYSILFAAYPDEYPPFLRMLGFSKNQIRDLQHGHFVLDSLKDRRPGEFGITAAHVFDVPGYFIRDYYSYVENFRNLRNFQTVGKFKSQPELKDLMPLTFSTTELQEFAACGQNCTLNLTNEEIAAIKQSSNLDELYRTILLNRVHDYLRNGTASEPYLRDFPHLFAYFPDVVDYLADYPASKDQRIPDFFYWVKENVSGKNVIAIRHVFTQRVHQDYVMVDHLVYSNHSLIASAFVLHLINYVDAGYPRTLLVYHGRNYVDSETGRATAVDKRLFAAFRSAGQELEQRYFSKAYPGFPYGLIPTDQR